jgi:diphthamide biosynthesis protein 2
LQRKLRQRFFQIQKAKLARVVGIVVTTVADHPHVRSVVTKLYELLQRHNRVAYTLVVGKLNPAKLANFAEIDCAVLVACPEHSLLDFDDDHSNANDYHVPVVTPLEMAMSLNVFEWGTIPFSLDTSDFLRSASIARSLSDEQDESGAADEGQDAPHFSPVSGRNESHLAPSVSAEAEHSFYSKGSDLLTGLQDRGVADTSSVNQCNGKSDLNQLQSIQYNSASSMFLVQREYQGLRIGSGSTPVHAAVPGKRGIASQYSPVKHANVKHANDISR